MHQIKVLHIIHWPRSGIVNLVYNQIISSENNSIKYRVGFFVENRDTQQKFERAGIEVAHYKYRAIRFYIALINLFLEIKRTKPQIIHTHSFLPGIFVRIIYLINKSFNVISTIHSPYPYLTKTTIKDKIKTYLEINSINLINCQVIAVSNHVKDHLLKYTKINISLIEVVYPGIIIKSENAKLSEYPEVTNKVIIVGRLDREKRHDRLLLIWEKVIKKIPTAELDIVGDGSEKQNLLKIVIELKLTQHVNFLGYKEDISDLLRSSCISVLTSDFEGFGIVVIESFLQKRPVVAFDINSLKEIVDSNCGILVKSFDIKAFAEKVVFLLNNPKVSKEMGINGYQKVKDKFNINRMVKQIENEYLGVVNFHLTDKKLLGVLGKRWG